MKRVGMRETRFSDCRRPFPCFYKCVVNGLLGKSVLGLLVLVLVAVTTSFATVLLQTYREYQHAAAREAEIQAEIVRLREAQAYREKYLRLMLDDPQFLERVVREKLGYVGPNETVFVFESERR